MPKKYAVRPKQIQAQNLSLGEIIILHGIRFQSYSELKPDFKNSSLATICTKAHNEAQKAFQCCHDVLTKTNKAINFPSPQNCEEPTMPHFVILAFETIAKEQTNTRTKLLNQATQYVNQHKPMGFIAAASEYADQSRETVQLAIRTLTNLKKESKPKTNQYLILQSAIQETTVLMNGVWRPSDKNRQTDRPTAAVL